jgi:hypothetical protein
MKTPEVPAKMPKGWLWAFLVVEAALVLSWLTLDTIRITSGPQVQPLSSPEILIRLVYSGTAMLLTVASPFFLRSLKWVALLGWGLGFLALILGGMYWMP